MFKYIFLGLLLVAVAVPLIAKANEKPRFSDSTLELCPEEFAPYEAEWTAECLVNAVRAWNIGALIELTADATAHSSAGETGLAMKTLFSVLSPGMGQILKSAPSLI